MSYSGPRAPLNAFLPRARHRLELNLPLHPFLPEVCLSQQDSIIDLVSSHLPILPLHRVLLVPFRVSYGSFRSHSPALQYLMLIGYSGCRLRVLARR